MVVYWKWSYWLDRERRNRDWDFLVESNIVIFWLNVLWYVLVRLKFIKPNTTVFFIKNRGKNRAMCCWYKSQSVILRINTFSFLFSFLNNWNLSEKEIQSGRKRMPVSSSIYQIKMQMLCRIENNAELQKKKKQ